jgi:hypothetical protein
MNKIRKKIINYRNFFVAAFLIVAIQSIMLTELRTKSKISGQEINLKVSSHVVKEKNPGKNSKEGGKFLLPAGCLLESFNSWFLHPPPLPPLFTRKLDFFHHVFFSL